MNPGPISQPRSRYIDLIFILLVAVCAILVVSSFRYLIFYSGADEGYYLKYAAVVSEYGPRALPALFKAYASDQNSWVFPNPFRIGFILTSALWAKIFGPTYFSLSSLSLFSYLLTLGISYYFSKKYFGERFALLFSVLLAFSPLNMAMARRALLDSTANLFLVSSLWLFFDMLEDRRKFKYALFTAIYALALLMKESAVLLAPAYIFYLLLRKYVMKRETLQNDFLCASVYPAIIAFIAYLISAGSLASVLKVIKIIIESPATNKYAILYCSGSWLRYIIDYLLISPWVLLFAVFFIAMYLFSGKKDAKIFYFLTVAVAYYLILNLFAKNIRYAMLLDTPIRLFAAFMITRIAESKSANYSSIAVLIMILAIVAYDYMSFYQIFVAGGVYDPVNALLLSVRGIAPLR